MSDTITIFDTTLRDGEQSPGCSMDTDEKLEVAKALTELGVDVIEAGFPIASPGDFEAVRRIAQAYGDRTVICGLARWRENHNLVYRVPSPPPPLPPGEGSFRTGSECVLYMAIRRITDALYEARGSTFFSRQVARVSGGVVAAGGGGAGHWR
jgi:hypothetical protein